MNPEAIAEWAQVALSAFGAIGGVFVGYAVLRERLSGLKDSLTEVIKSVDEMRKDQSADRGEIARLQERYSHTTAVLERHEERIRDVDRRLYQLEERCLARHEQPPLRGNPDRG